MAVAESEDEIIATAMLMGAEFIEGPTFLLRGKHPTQWRTIGQPRWYTNKKDAALKHLSVRGVELNFDGILVNLKE